MSVHVSLSLSFVSDEIQIHTTVSSVRNIKHSTFLDTRHDQFS